MSDKMIFFSYSRDDSEFVLNLAKELRNAGANVWLDQLDIKPGTRWDKSIENALDASGTVLVVLSNTSVGSNNVMDEVSYALEERKTVIPVLLEECDVPFRLRRLQFADFTKSHDEGMLDMANALDLKPKVEAKIKDEAVETKVDESTPIVENKAPREDRVDPAPKKSKSKFVWFTLIGMAVIVGALAIGGVFSKKEDPVKKKDRIDIVKKEDNSTPEREVQIDYELIQDELDKIAQTIKFESAVAKVAGDGTEINRLTDIMNKYPQIKINIGVHSDSMGRDQLNLTLTEKRAEYIKKILISKGIDAKRINAKGFGETKPIAENQTSLGRSKNRRVEITLIKG